MDHAPDFYKGLLDNLAEGVYFVDRERRITYWNRGAERITGYSAAEATGRLCSENFLKHVNASGEELCLIGCPLAACVRQGAGQEGEIFLRHREGHRVPVLVRANPILDPEGNMVGAVEVFRDNSAAMADRERAESMERLALVDALTGIGNRRYLEARIRAKLEQAHRYGWPLGLAMVDIDHFKEVNDTYGHQVGDRVLQTVARTLERTARSFDVVGRWGGEEFVAALTNVTEEDAVRAARRFCRLVASSGTSVDGREVRVTVSVGLTGVRPRDTFESLLLRADRLMYSSKGHGRNRVTTDLLASGPERRSSG